MTRTTRRSPRLATAGAGLALLGVLTACGNGPDTKNADVSAPINASSSSSTSTDPRATMSLRTACVSTNDDIADANKQWNGAADSHKGDDLKKATATMTKLAGSLRAAGKDAKDATFSTKAEAVAKQVDALVKSEKPSKTVDTSTYNDDVNALTSYCSSVFPKPSESPSSETPESGSSLSGSASSTTSQVTSPTSATGASHAASASASK